ncbi:hypothetical protein ACNKHU_03800 [Shigella flexneri]
MAIGYQNRCSRSCVESTERHADASSWPDWSGIHASDNADPPTERLSIVDVNAGRNLSTTNKKLRTGGKRRTHNHGALRAEMAIRHQFQTGSDCEVILALYQEKGPYFLMTCRGMFALPCTTAKKMPTRSVATIWIIRLYMGYDEHGSVDAGLRNEIAGASSPDD